MLSNKQIERIYTELLRDLKPMIENHSGSMSAFCKTYGIDRSNLVKIFSENQDRKSQPDLSVGLFNRISVALGIMPASSAWPADSQVYSLSLKTYLLIDHNSIKDSMLIVSNS